MGIITTYEDYTPEELAVMSRNDCPGAMDHLLGKFKPLVLKMARARFLAGGDRDDMIQEGMIGLYKAARDFDPSKESSFMTFAVLCIDRQMMRAIEASLREKNRPLNNSVELGDDAVGSLQAPPGENPESYVIMQEMQDEMMAGLRDSLSPFEREVLRLYLMEMSIPEIADELGRTVKSVDNAFQRIKRKSRALRK